MFATPVAYLIDEAGIIAQDVAVGLEPILKLMAIIMNSTNRSEATLGCHNSVVR
jgi:hypothetical protein